MVLEGAEKIAHIGFSSSFISHTSFIHVRIVDRVVTSLTQ